MNKIPSKFHFEIGVFLCLALLALFLALFRWGDPQAQQAEESYHRGEAASTIAERKNAFNIALNLFLQLDETYHPNFGNGKLNYNIGNTYFQLGEYPLSILYYKRAENLMPRSELIKRNLLQAYKKAGLKSGQTPQAGLDILLLSSYFSLAERLQVFFILAILVLFFASAWLWTNKQWLSNIGMGFLFLLIILLLNLVITYYFSPIEAVLLKATELHRDAGFEFAKVGSEPLLGGSAIEVIDVSPNGKWLKVATPEGAFGYIPSESAKLVH